MSFSVEFYAGSKAKAVRKLADKEHLHLPESVREFLLRAVEALPSGDEDIKRVVHVKAHGHLCERPGDYQVSSATIEVRELVAHV